MKPCPRCGSDKLDTKCSALDDIGFCGTKRVWYVLCYGNGCQIRGPIRDTQVEAEKAWDERGTNAG